MGEGPRLGRIFISYRRGDSSAMAGRLADRLDAHFGAGTVFMDVQSITPGGNFTKTIEDATGSCSVLLAIIGSRWLTIADEHGRRRIDLPDDFVALEISSGLARRIPVIPVLIDGAAPPRKDDRLPPPLATLPQLQALRVDHEQFRTDVANLIGAIEPILSTGDRQVATERSPVEPPQPTTDMRRKRSRPIAVALLTTCAVAAVAIGFFTWPTRGSGDGLEPSAGPTSSAATSAQAPAATPSSGAVFSDDFSGSSFDPLKWKPVSKPDVIQQADGHLRLFARPGSGIDYAKLEPLPLSGPFTDVRFTVTMPSFGRGSTGGGSFVINPRGLQPQVMTFGPGDAGGVIAYPLLCDRPQCSIATYADFTESSYHYPTPPRPGDALAIEISRHEGRLVYTVNGALAGATKNDTGPLTEFWFAASADSQESWDLLIDDLVVR